MQTRSIAKQLSISMVRHAAQCATQSDQEYERGAPYPVLDFDEASRHWTRNKVKLANGMYRYKEESTATATATATALPDQVSAHTRSHRIPTAWQVVS